MIVLEAIRVWNWRGLDALALEDLAPDLNLVVGPNESGKSRLFEALRHALFERYKGQGYGRAGLQGWWSDEAPEVEVLFRADGHHYTIRKRFLRREFARLEGAGHTWRDDDAELRLRELLGTREHDRVLRPEHLGIWPVLWVSQGRSALAPHEDLHADGRARIHDALASEVDEVAAGPRGQQVVERVAVEHARYWQPQRGLPAGELKAAREALELAEAAERAAVERRDAARALADALTEATAQAAVLAPRAAALREAAGQCSSREAAARDLAAAIDVHGERVGRLRGLAERAEGARDERSRLERDAARAASDLSAVDGDTATLDEARVAAERALESATAEVEVAEQAEQQAEQRFSQALRQERRREVARVAARKRDACDRAEALERAVEAARGSLRACAIAPLVVQQIRQAAREHGVAVARREAAAVAVEIRALRDVVVRGEALPAGASRTFRIDRTERIAIDDAFEVVVTPGDGLLGKLADDERDAATHLARLLAEHGLASPAEAEERLERDATAREGLSNLEGRLRQAAPDGLDALRAEADSAAATLADLGPAGPVLALPLATEAPIDRDAAQAEHRLAREALEAARARRNAHTSRAAAAREACAVLRARRAGLAATSEALAARITGLSPQADLDAAFDEARRRWHEERDVLEGLQRRWQAEGGAGAADDAERARRSWEAIEGEHEALAAKVADLRARLDVLGGERLHEDVLDAQSTLATCRDDAARVERRALAARRLKEALDTARQRAQERLLAPVRARVEPYLGEMFPGSGLDLDEAWSVRGLKTGDTAEAFDLLSGGAREQLSVIVRLGLAEVLGDGERLPVVLDDALVNSDPARLARMLRVLYRASKRLQVLVFSCHEVAFDGLGASRVFRLPGSLKGRPAPGESLSRGLP